MKKDIKKEILETGFRLFSEKGYANVSMRDIADASGMSVGNLTYHFKKKEDLIEAVIIEQCANFPIPPTPENLRELNELFLLGIEHQKKDDYFFRYFEQLPHISPRIYEILVDAIIRRKNKLLDSLELLCKSGLVKPEEFTGQRAAMVDVMNMIKIYWTPGNEAFSSAKESPLICLWSIIFPILTEKGRTAYHDEVRF